jgi:hypothetical protein
MPRGLGEEGKAFWKATTRDYELDGLELRLLEDACREADLIDGLCEAIDSSRFRLTSRGSMGQTVANPLLGEVRQHRALLSQIGERIRRWKRRRAGGSTE